MLYTPSLADSQGAATYPIERIKKIKFMQSVNMDGIPQQHDNREVYLLHSSQRNSVTIEKKKLHYGQRS